MDYTPSFSAGAVVMIECERPYAFYALLLLIPAVLITLSRFRRISRALGGFYDVSDEGAAAKIIRRLRRSLLLRSIFRVAAWILLVLAYAGFSWGTAPVPVQRSGTAVCFVFDISYSMMAKDGPGGLSRLDASRQYAAGLLARMQGTAVSVVLAKGDGIIAVPLTADRAAVDALLGGLSPRLMTAAGSSLGKGITAALHSFPRTAAQAACVWVFTDGDETDGGLADALADSVHYGIPVTLIGFGSVQGTTVSAGDGETRIKTVLRAERMRSLAAAASKKAPAVRHFSVIRTQPVQYIEAAAPASALRLLGSLHGNREGEEEAAFTYELQPVKRYGLFLLLALVFFLISFVCGELVILPRRRTVLLSLSVLLCLPLLSSCSLRTKDGAQILKSSWAWYQKKYQLAVAGFLQSVSDGTARKDAVVTEYAAYGLGVTYMMQEENDAALERFSQIPPDAPQQVRYAALYNSGIIAARIGDYRKASEYFKQAVLADGSKPDAKINLELSLKHQSLHQAPGGEREMSPVADENDESMLEKAVFTRIRENEQNRWKNMQSDKKDQSVVDY
jgi:Ca-activated chloride channel homolog